MALAHPLTVDTFQSCRGPMLKHRPILCHLSQAELDKASVHPIPGGLLLATACSQTTGTYTANSPAHTRHPNRSLSLDGCESRNTAQHGVHQRDPLRSVQDVPSQLQTRQGLTQPPSRHPHPQCDVHSLRRPLPRAQYVEPAPGPDLVPPFAKPGIGPCGVCHLQARQGGRRA